MSAETPDGVLERLTPVGLDAPRLSAAERHRRTRRTASNQDVTHFNAHAAVYAEEQAAKNARGALTGLAAIMSLATQQQLASTIAEKFGGKLVAKDSDQRLTPSAAKQYAAAWGIATDKLTILQGRPTQVMAVEEAELQRPAILALAVKLAELAQTSVDGQATEIGIIGHESGKP